MKLLIESYKISDKVQVLVNVKLKGNEGIGDIAELYKSEINKEFFLNRGFGKLRVSVVKRAISEFETMSKDKYLLLDMMIFSIEMGTKFIEEFGDIDEDMVDYMTKKYDSIVNFLNKKGGIELFKKFINRLEPIVKDTNNVGCWGIHDSFEGSFSQLKWLEDDEDTDDV